MGKLEIIVIVIGMIALLFIGYFGVYKGNMDAKGFCEEQDMIFAGWQTSMIKCVNVENHGLYYFTKDEFKDHKKGINVVETEE